MTINDWKRELNYFEKRQLSTEKGEILSHQLEELTGKKLKDKA